LKVPQFLFPPAPLSLIPLHLVHVLGAPNLLINELSPELFTPQAQISDALLKEQSLLLKLHAAPNVESTQRRGLRGPHLLLDPSLDVIDMYFTPESVARVAILKLHEESLVRGVHIGMIEVGFLEL
jgi:hypothetical protein